MVHEIKFTQFTFFHPLTFLLNQTNEFSIPPLFPLSTKHLQRKLKYLLFPHLFIRQPNRS